VSGKCFAGTSGLVVAIPKRDFGPEFQDKSRLAYYAQQENSIEINSTFYRVPQAKTIKRWAEEVPADFRFTFKLCKAVTHQKNLLFRAEDIAAFMHSISGAVDKQGCLLVQFPPSLQAGALPQLKELIEGLRQYNWPLAVEFRHLSWYKEEIFNFLNSNDIALVIHDMPKSASPFKVTATDRVYLRFHGPSGNYKGCYAEGFLYEYGL
jgi:uncharacterized protein YecE (DUF72 family)